MKKWLRMPKNIMILALFLLFLVAIPQMGIVSSVYLFVLCLVFTAVSDIIFTYIKFRKYLFPASAVISGFILTLIIEPSAAWYQILVICASAMAIKVFVRFGNRHIFNPAASGLLVGFLAFGLFPSWWAPSPYTLGTFSLGSILVYLPIFFIGYVSLYRYRRWRVVVAFLVAYIIASQILNPVSFNGILTAVISHGALFYCFAMLVEPVTSPVNRTRQVYYGIFVAVVSVVLIFVSRTTNFVLFDASLTALLLGNLLFFKLR